MNDARLVIMKGFQGGFTTTPAGWASFAAQA
jgi:hypothetical protein